MDQVHRPRFPAGFLRVTKRAFVEIASFKIVPDEVIIRWWRAFTAAFRLTGDPRTGRLENFWWHVWGSDRKNLSGPVLARLLRRVTLGRTYVPLGRPRKPSPSPSEPTSDEDPTEPAMDQNERKGPPRPSSSSKYPPAPRPILKKNSSPSGSGRKPTARFHDPPITDIRRFSNDDASESNPTSTTAGAEPETVAEETTASQTSTPETIDPQETASVETASSSNENPEPQETVSAEMPYSSVTEPEPETAAPLNTPSCSVTKTEPFFTEEMPPPPTPPAKRKILPSSISSTPGAGMARPPPQVRKIPTAWRRPVVLPRRQSSQSTTSSPTTRLASPGGATTTKIAETRRSSTELRASEQSTLVKTLQTTKPTRSAKPSGKQTLPEPTQAGPSKSSAEKALQTDGPLDQPETPRPTKSRDASQPEAVQPETSQPEPKVPQETKILNGLNVGQSSDSKDGYKPPLKRNEIQQKYHAPPQARRLQGPSNPQIMSGPIAEQQSPPLMGRQLSQIEMSMAIALDLHKPVYDPFPRPSFLMSQPCPFHNHQPHLWQDDSILSRQIQLNEHNRQRSLVNNATAPPPTTTEPQVQPPLQPNHHPQALPGSSRQTPSGVLNAPGPSQQQTLIHPPPSFSKMRLNARRRRNTAPAAAAGLQTLERRSPPMAIFAPKHPIGTPFSALIRSHVDLLFSKSSVGAPTTTTAEGILCSDTTGVHPEVVLPEARDVPDRVRYAKGTLPSVLEPKFKPTPRNRNPSPPPFTRIKGELCMLLERSGGMSDARAMKKPLVVPFTASDGNDDASSSSSARPLI